MNKDFQKINEEEVLFFDCEIVRRNKELKVDSEEYSLYQKKTRDRETDEYLPDNELVEDYDRKAALKMCYNKIVTIGVGYIKDNEAYIKDITGTEEEVIEQFSTIANQFRYVCGANILGYDLPMIINNGWRYHNMAELLKDDFITSNKKPWNLDKVLDLMQTFKGTYFYNSSLEEICYHFGIPTPKDDISGAEVSETYYAEGIDRISSYVKKDVLANINIFRKMRAGEIFSDFIDRGEAKIEDNRTFLERLYDANSLTSKLVEELDTLTSKKRLTKLDKKHLFTILRGVLLRTDFVNGDQDNKATKEEKENQITEYINSL